MKQAWIVMAMGWMLASCGTRPPLEVRTTHLRSLELTDPQDEPMIRAEQRRLLHGAIGVREQEQALGQYYTALWHDGSTDGPVKVVFRYQQGGTGSRIHEKTATFAADQTEGRAEFEVIGDDYLKGGRVLAWQCKLFRGGREIASRRSYLWE
ncbi:hypothetical protein [Haloferula sargassicola]|uniref:Lipoprotein n=1 Tax=Haloferula sargassicola TaxID=490096 RepID=A0ABP9UR92_9BACT